MEDNNNKKEVSTAVLAFVVFVVVMLLASSWDNELKKDGVYDNVDSVAKQIQFNQLNK